MRIGKYEVSYDPPKSRKGKTYDPDYSGLVIREGNEIKATFCGDDADAIYLLLREKTNDQ